MGGQTFHGTAIMWINDANEIVVAADSKVIPSTSYLNADGAAVQVERPATFDACKLRAVGRAVVGVAGTVGVGGQRSVLDLEMPEIRSARTARELQLGIDRWLGRAMSLYRRAIADDPGSFDELSRRNRSGIFLQATFVMFNATGGLVHFTSEASYAPSVGIRTRTNAVTGEGFGGIGEMKPIQLAESGEVRPEISQELLSGKTTRERAAALQKTIRYIANDPSGREVVGGPIDVVAVTKDGIRPLMVKGECAGYFLGR